ETETDIDDPPWVTQSALQGMLGYVVFVCRAPCGCGMNDERVRLPSIRCHKPKKPKNSSHTSNRTSVPRNVGPASSFLPPPHSKDGGGDASLLGPVSELRKKAHFLFRLPAMDYAPPLF
ncbi:uncharacterized, partial [Tachysurus ichikawai]